MDAQKQQGFSVGNQLKEHTMLRAQIAMPLRCLNGEQKGVSGKIQTKYDNNQRGENSQATNQCNTIWIQ